MKYRVIHEPTGDVVIPPHETSREELEDSIELALSTALMIEADSGWVLKAIKNYKIEEVEE